VAARFGTRLPYASSQKDGTANPAGLLSDEPAPDDAT
jgi:hypothetical protein